MRPSALERRLLPRVGQQVPARRSDVLCDTRTGNIGWDPSLKENQGKTEAGPARQRRLQRPHGPIPRLLLRVCYADACWIACWLLPLAPPACPAGAADTLRRDAVGGKTAAAPCRARRSAGDAARAATTRCPRARRWNRRAGRSRRRHRGADRPLPLAPGTRPGPVRRGRRELRARGAARAGAPGVPGQAGKLLNDVEPDHEPPAQGVEWNAESGELRLKWLQVGRPARARDAAWKVGPGAAWSRSNRLDRTRHDAGGS